MKKVGILGGGQLGRMLLQAGANYPVETFVLEQDENAPAAMLCHHFVKGDIKNYDDVYNFGKNLDALTIEIEHINLDALEQLEKEGVQVFPKPAVLKIICDKSLQKQYYDAHNIPTAPYIITQDVGGLQKLKDWLPAVHKLSRGGYDGRGVQVLNNEADLEKAFDAPAVLEKQIKLHKEIAMIIAVNNDLQWAIYPAVEMIFDPHLNLLDYQLCPAALPEETYYKAEVVALQTVKHFNSPGIFAVEMFVTADGDVLVNETAPRVHNSGHHTIEAHYSSQFDMVWRVILNYPLGNTKPIMHSAMINLVGAENYSGDAVYSGLEDVMKIENAFVHIYGKKQTKPGRKMGHVTIMSNEKADLLHKANKIKHNFSIISRDK